MALELAQIQEILKSPPKSQRRLAIEHENRVRFHSETTLGRFDTSSAINEFLRYVSGILPADKFNMFLHLVRFPVDTVTVTEEIYEALEKIYDGQNPVFEYEFPNEKILEDWENYRLESKQDDFWRYEAWDTMKNAINSLMIVDLESEQSESRPSPYTYFLNLSDVIAYKCEAQEFEWVIFWSDREKKEVAVFDDENYRVYEVKDNWQITSTLVDNSHELGYCPARFFWTTPKSLHQKEIKKSPISNYLGKLDSLLFNSVSKKALDTYASYPIVSVFRTDCDFYDAKSQEECHRGFLKNNQGNYILLTDRATGYSSPKQCPVCSKKNLAGAGSKILMDTPSPDNDMADLRNPIQFHQVNRDILDYNVDELKRLTQEIIAAATGGSIESINNKAVNEKQVMSLFEGRKAALRKVQENIERARKWSDETQCLLRYGSNVFQGAFISYGTEYFLLSETQLLELYEKSKKAGVSHIILDYLQDQYFQTKYRNNREGLMRSKILVNLEPFRHHTSIEVQGFEVIDPKEQFLKFNFSSLIQRFERENTNVTAFGNEIDFDKKIERINETLLSYISIPDVIAEPIEE